MDVHLWESNAKSVNTTNLNFYKLEVTAKTSGLTGMKAHGRVMAQFLTPSGPVLTISFPAIFTTNYQVFSYVLGNGNSDPWEPGGWSGFFADFSQINAVNCVISADDWLHEYDLTKENALYVGNVKFVRLIPDLSAASSHR